MRLLLRWSASRRSLSGLGLVNCRPERRKSVLQLNLFAFNICEFFPILHIRLGLLQGINNRLFKPDHAGDKLCVSCLEISRLIRKRMVQSFLRILEPLLRPLNLLRVGIEFFSLPRHKGCVQQLI